MFLDLAFFSCLSRSQVSISQPLPVLAFTPVRLFIPISVAQYFFELLHFLLVSSAALQVPPVFFAKLLMFIPLSSSIFLTFALSPTSPSSNIVNFGQGPNQLFWDRFRPSFPHQE